MLTPQREPASGAVSTSESGDAAQAEVWLAEHVRRAVTAHTVNDEEAMTEALHALCGAARRAELPVERILVLLKRYWQSHTADVPLRAGPTDDRLARLVSACITMYYRAD
ncbi:MAG: hypothetical protein ACYC2G_09335 [Gemmatimonadaceae bacterium]